MFLSPVHLYLPKYLSVEKKRILSGIETFCKTKCGPQNCKVPFDLHKDLFFMSSPFPYWHLQDGFRTQSRNGNPEVLRSQKKDVGSYN